MGSHQDHRHNRTGNRRAFVVALACTLGYAGVEFIGGAAFGSLALMSDAGHMLSDSAALALAAFAAWIGSRPAGARHSYGFARAEVIAAFVNGLVMLMIVALIAAEAAERLMNPQPVAGAGVVVVAVFGLLINLFVAFVLGRGDRNLNTRAALIHVIGDLIGSVAAIVAGAVVHVTGWQPIDPLLSIVIGLLILGSTVKLLRDALHVLMEGVPRSVRLDEVGEALSRLDGVVAVHDLHVWNISSGQVALSAHVELNDLASWPTMLESARRMLQQRFRIEHVTLQPELTGGINRDLRARVRILPLHRHNGGH